MPLKESDFLIVPEDLIAAVIDYVAWLESHGFKVEPEPYDLEYPNTPVLKATRSAHQEYFYEVSSKVNLERALDWVKYGKASSKDVRYVVVIANGRSIRANELGRLREAGIGVHLMDDNGVNQVCHPHDLSISFEFPTLPRPLQKKLATARDLFTDGHWKESYEDACQALESDARAHLAKRIKNGASFVSSKGKPILYTEAQVGKMTLGGVGKAFLELANPTQNESRVAQAISRINPNRVTVAHFKAKTGVRAQKLREQVGKDLIVIVNTMMMLR